MGGVIPLRAGDVPVILGGTNCPAPPAATKVYVVMIRVEPSCPDGPNVEVYGAKLTRSAADTLAENVPGAWVEKVRADKS